MAHNLVINTNKDYLDIGFINGFISNSYWGKGRTEETMQTCINNSLNFGVYLQKKQIGYARVVTDYVQLAYLMDLFIDEPHRRKGYASELMKSIMTSKELKDIKVWRLATTQAHALYKKFGFNEVAKPENLMEKLSQL